MQISNIGYLLFKPESEKHFSEMRQYIENNFEKVQYFAVLDWQHIIRKLYHKHYEEKGESFEDMLEALLESVNQLYGNNAIIALVKDTSVEKDKLVKRVYQTKKHLRNLYSKPNAISIISNSDELGIHQHKKIKNKIKIIDENGEEKRFKCMNLPGNYRIQFLNFIHSPDDSVKENDEELTILQQEGILSRRFLMSKEDVDLVGQYKTFAITEKYRQTEERKSITDSNELELD